MQETEGAETAAEKGGAAQDTYTKPRGTGEGLWAGNIAECVVLGGRAYYSHGHTGQGYEAPQQAAAAARARLCQPQAALHVVLGKPAQAWTRGTGVTLGARGWGQELLRFMAGQPGPWLAQLRPVRAWP